MVIVTLRIVGVFTANVDDGVARCENGGIAAADEGGGVVGREQAEEIDGKSLVGVKGTAMSADEGPVEFWAFGKGFVVCVVRGGHGADRYGLEWSR